MLRRLDHLRSQTLAIVALISVFVAATVVSPYIPGTTLHAQQVGPGGVPGAGGGSGGGAVGSVFGRTGTVTASSGDYTCAQVTGCPTSVVSSFNTRAGAVVPATGDYTAAQVTNAAATNAANSFGANQTIASGYSLVMGGGYPMTITNTTGSAQALTFGTSRYPGFFFIRDNAVGTAGLYLLNNATAFGWAASPTSAVSTSIESPAVGVINMSFSTPTIVQAKLYQAGVGSQLTAAATIAPTYQIHHITGATQITTITPPTNFASGWIGLIPDDASGQSTGTTGNIALGTTMIQNRLLILSWDGTKWYPSY